MRCVWFVCVLDSCVCGLWCVITAILVTMIAHFTLFVKSIFYIFFWFICFCLYIAIIFYSSAYHDFLLVSCMYIPGIISGLFLCLFFPLHDMGAGYGIRPIGDGIRQPSHSSSHTQSSPYHHPPHPNSKGQKRSNPLQNNRLYRCSESLHIHPIENS